MKNINIILRDMPRSGIRRIMDDAISIDPESNRIIHLEVGQPQNPTSEIICKALADAALQGYTKYTQNAGLFELRKALVNKLSEKDIININENNIFITPGATYGVSVVIGTLINNGDEVLVPDPGYPNFAAAVRHYGGKVKYYPLTEENNFQMDFNNLKSLVTDKTKLIIINSPSNPTGTVLSKTNIKNLTNFTSKNNIWLLSDEVYESFVYSKDYISPLSFQNVDNIIGIYSFSKSYNVTGLRIGYVVSNNKYFCDAFLKAQELYISCAPSVSQMAAITALNECGSEVLKLKNEFKNKIKVAINLFGNLVNYVPDGAFYILLDICKSGLSSDEFANALLKEENVAVAPGSTFGPTANKYIRIALTPETDILINGIKKIKEFYLKKRRNFESNK